MCARPWRTTTPALAPRCCRWALERVIESRPSSRAGLAAIGLALLVSGCAPSALSGARHNIAAGQYAAAHQQLMDLSAHGANLTPSEHREVNDDICLTEFMIGRPQYTLHEQQRVCSEAAAAPGSQSTQMLARVDDQLRQELSARTVAALNSGDLATAEDSANEYTALPGADPDLVAEWSAKMWKLAATEGESNGRARKREISAAIADASRDYPKMKHMGEREFRRWIAKTAEAGGTPLVHKTSMSRDALKLWVARDQVHAAVLNLDKFVKINDAMTARCGCDARTDVGVLESGFPLCVVRLDPDTRRSEVLVLPRGASPPPPPSQVSAAR
jgi:hypothetical protein